MVYPFLIAPLHCSLEVVVHSLLRIDGPFIDLPQYRIGAPILRNGESGHGFGGSPGALHQSVPGTLMISVRESERCIGCMPSCADYRLVLRLLCSVQLGGGVGEVCSRTGALCLDCSTSFRTVYSDSCGYCLFVAIETQHAVHQWKAVPDPSRHSIAESMSHRAAQVGTRELVAAFTACPPLTACIAFTAFTACTYCIDCMHCI